MISVEDERNFENMLFADASALPPPQDTVTPWRTAMNYILWGLGLTTITLQFLNLDVLLTAVGAALLVLGFLVSVTFYRCPHCHRVLPANRGKMDDCPYCKLPLRDTK